MVTGASDDELDELDGFGLIARIDEYQRVPALLHAIKARLNQETRPGMFVLAGSASYDSPPHGTQALTGRIQRCTLSRRDQSRAM